LKEGKRKGWRKGQEKAGVKARKYGKKGQ